MQAPVHPAPTLRRQRRRHAPLRGGKLLVGICLLGTLFFAVGAANEALRATTEAAAAEHYDGPIVASALATDSAALATGAGLALGEPPVWIATHAVTMLWDGPGSEATSRGRLPIGSYFRLLGDAREGRLPVHYPGNSSIPAGEYWIDVAAIGPTSAPSADWTEPEWPPRRLVTGQRGEVVRGDASLPMIALTFDAGAGSGAVGRLLDVLGERNVKATFFVAGAFADRYESVLRRIAADGHELANHSYSHPDFRTLSDDQMRVELRRGTVSIETAAGARVAPLWRPPFGSRDDRVLRIVEEEGFRSVYWTFDSGDWLTTATTERVRDAVLRQAVSGAIVVHHVSPDATANAMPTIIDELRRRGYELVSVGEMIGP